MTRGSRTSTRLAVLSAVFALALASAAAGASDGPVAIARSETHHLTSEAIGQEFRLEVLMPRGYEASEERYPVIYLTDSEMLFPLVSASLITMQLAAEVPPVIVVGIAYEVEDLMQAGMLRTRELTPTNDEAWAEQARKSPVLPLPPDVDPGGGPAFLAFIESRVKPFIESTYRVDEDDQTLVGYSLGGLFGLYALFNRPDAFDRYVIGSPSIWWDQTVALDYESRYAKAHTDLAKKVFLSVGSREEPLSDEDTSNMVENMKLMYERLRSRGYPSLRIEHVVFADETHTSGVAAAISRGLRTVFQPDWR